MVVTCKVCGEPMKADHGIIDFSGSGGTTWWQCTCGRRVRERYEVKGLKIVTLEAVEIQTITKAEICEL